MSPAIQQAPHIASELVLLVDDHGDTREMYSSYLTHCGYQVDDIATTTEAIGHLARRTPDVIVTDLKLPGADGLQFCRTLRTSAATKDVPLIAVTAWADSVTVREARDAGCAAILLKPCLPADLRLEIARVLEASRAARRSAESARQRARTLMTRSATLVAKSQRLVEDLIQGLRSLTQRGSQD